MGKHYYLILSILEIAIGICAAIYIVMNFREDNPLRLIFAFASAVLGFYLGIKSFMTYLENK